MDFYALFRYSNNLKRITGFSHPAINGCYLYHWCCLELCPDQHWRTAASGKWCWL